MVKCIIQVHPLSSTVLIPIGLLLLLNYHILARSSTFQLSLLSSSNSCQPHFFHKFKKHKNIELHQLFVSSSLQFTTLFDFNSKFWNGTSSCSLHWGIFSVFICTGIFYILWGMRRNILYHMFLFAQDCCKACADSDKQVGPFFDCEEHLTRGHRSFKQLYNLVVERQKVNVTKIEFDHLKKGCVVKNFFITTNDEAMKYTFLLVP